MRLDEFIHRITDTLERGNQINRSDLSKENSVGSK
jgi:hypothetical protein